MPGDGKRGPVAVVEGALDEPLVEIALADVGAPRAREVERALLGAQMRFFAVLVRPAVEVGFVSSTAGFGGWGGVAPPVPPVRARAPPR